MTKKGRMIFSLLMAVVMVCVSIAPVQVFAAGTETLPLGEYSVGGFTFTDQNLTPVKTMPAGAHTLNFLIRFKKADIDTGVGQVKLTVQVRDMNGNVVASKVVDDISGYVTGSYKRATTVFIDDIPVTPGQQFQLWFDASSVDPSQSNGSYRSIQIVTFVSYVNVDEIVIVS